MEKLNISLNEEEKNLIQEKYSPIHLDKHHNLYVKIFLEQIIPFIEKNPGYKQADLIKRLPDNKNGIYSGIDFHSKIREFLYYLSKENLIERRKNGITYELFLKSDVSQIKDFLTPNATEWGVKISYKPPPDININCRIYRNSEQMIVNYFGEKTIAIFRRHGIVYNPNFSGHNLSNIGSCLKFEMNDVLKQILEKYWTTECEKALKNYLLKWGFFADYTFTRVKLRDIIGKEKLMELFAELNRRASEFRILWCGWDTIKSYHIPYNFIGSFKFKWGLKPDIIEKKCEYCSKNFIPIYHLSSEIDSFEQNNFSIRSLNEIDFCMEHALGKNILMRYNEATISKDRMIQLINDLIKLIGFIPPSSYKDNLTYLNCLDKNSFNKVIKLLNDMPPYEKSYSCSMSYKEVFGSWLKALIAAGVLENNAQKMSIGYRCLANDGHECYSLAEKNIDDWLHLHNIPHEKEPAYPTGYLRADWKVDKFFIEYWGLKGDEDYDEKILIKREILKEYNIPLIEINQDDLPNLEMKLNILKNDGNLNMN